jgi:hypothetical protein
MEDLGNKNSRGRHADGSKTRQAANFVAVWKGTRFVIEGRLAIRFDLRNLIADEFIVSDHAFNIATQEWWQWPTVTGHHCMEATEQPFPNSLAAEPNAVQGEQPLDPADDTSPFLNQVLALALDPLGIFLLDRRKAHSRGNRTIAGKPGSKNSGHLLGIKPISLG